MERLGRGKVQGIFHIDRECALNTTLLSNDLHFAEFSTGRIKTTRFHDGFHDGDRAIDEHFARAQDGTRDENRKPGRLQLDIDLFDHQIGAINLQQFGLEIFGCFLDGFGFTGWAQAEDTIHTLLLGEIEVSRARKGHFDHVADLNGRTRIGLAIGRRRRRGGRRLATCDQKESGGSYSYDQSASTTGDGGFLEVTTVYEASKQFHHGFSILC